MLKQVRHLSLNRILFSWNCRQEHLFKLIFDPALLYLNCLFIQVPSVLQDQCGVNHLLHHEVGCRFFPSLLTHLVELAKQLLVQRPVLNCPFKASFKVPITSAQLQLERFLSCVTFLLFVFISSDQLRVDSIDELIRFRVAFDNYIACYHLRGDRVQCKLSEVEWLPLITKFAALGPHQGPRFLHDLKLSSDRLTFAVSGFEF